MASISLPLQSQDAAHHNPPNSPGSSAYGLPRRRSQMPAPVPNPHFVFPASDPDESRNEIQSMAQTPTPTRTPPPLPAFSFNPGAGHSSSPSSPSALGVPRHTAHRRQLSELVGLERERETGAAATGSQAPNDSSFPAPAKLPVPGPGFSAPSRRFHAHRRSAAISSVDLTMISKGLDLGSTAGSAPSTPSTMRQQRTMNDEIARPMSHSETSLNLPPPTASSFLFPDNKLHPRETRGLYDGPFYHKRPLSTISSETSGSVPAAQAEPVADPTEPAPNIRTESNQSTPKRRPKTADAAMRLASSASMTTNLDTQVQRPSSASAHPLHEGPSVSNSTYLGDDLHSGEHLGRSSSEDESDRSFEIDRDTLGTSPSSASKQRSCGLKKRRKKAKVRSWAGALLTRGKSKSSEEEGSGEQEQTAPKPPILTRTNSDLGSGLDVNFDDDEIVVLRSPSSTNVSEVASLAVETSTSPSLESSWKPRSFYEQTTQPDTFSPVIDLDAALGPFNTPEMAPNRAVGSGFSAARERMYSGGRRGEFVGPEMRYHRRAESAPEMPPVDRSFLGFSRLGPSAALATAEVFDEEEEDAFLAAGNDDAVTSAATSPTMQSTLIVDDAVQNEDLQSLSGPDDTDTITPVASSSDKRTQGLGIQQCLPANQVPRQPAVDATTSEELAQSEQPVAVEAHERTVAADPGSSPTATQPFQQERWAQVSRPFATSSPDVSPRFIAVDKRPSTSPVKIPHRMPVLTLQAGSSNPDSTFPSPDLCGSSVGAARSITTPSTIDRNFSNLSYSTDPSLDQPPASFEDIPSLTSSASTMTTTMNRISATFFRQRGSGERSASFSHHGTRRTSQANTSKRSSLASLSKLMVNPHAERSKLSLVETPPGDEPEKAKKRGRKLSRLIHFWRPKDKDRMGEEHEQSQGSDEH